jgi:Helix-turn-helix domain
MREAVRSGRRANFFITENRFIDHYAAKVGGSGVAVYSILQRCANSETRETWISAGKMADVLAMDKSTVYRYLKQLEDLRLIRSMRTREKTIYVVLPVPPPRPEAGSTPLFDVIDFKTADQESTWPVVASEQTSRITEIDSYERDVSVASAQRTVSSAQPISRTSKNHNKEEQDLLNKTQEQDFLNKTLENDNSAIHEAAQRIINILGLPETSVNAAMAAVELKARGTKLSVDEIVLQIWPKALQAERKTGSRESYLEDCLAEILAERILDEINLPPTNNLISIVTGALKAEVKDRKLGLEETAAIITTAAIEDRRKGTEINRFYFENCKWRSNAGVSKAERRKLDNLEVNAKVKQRLRERLGAS